MKALAIEPGQSGVKMVERPEPSIVDPRDVKVRIGQVGICGTDREEATGGRARPPDGARDLVIGHEMLGTVVEVGPAVTSMHPGDLAVVTVRRGCGQCSPCAMGRSDMCATGDYRERGIWRLDGFQSECVVDAESYVIKVPVELQSIGVLTEPLSVAEKAIDEAVRLQTARLPDAGATPHWLCGRRCLVAGLGPIGLLAAMTLRLRGADVAGLDVVEADTARPQWLAAIGGEYLDGRGGLEKGLGSRTFDVILDATGIAPLEFNLIDALGMNGVYILTGIPAGERPIEVPGAELIRRLVLRNQVMFGSVNASVNHFQQAVADLATARLRWGGHVERLITHRSPPDALTNALERHDPDDIKAVVEWG